MEELCPFYYVDQGKVPPSRVIRSDHQIASARITYPIPWCSHKHSVATRHQARATGGKLLSCQGDFPTKCQVPEALRGDI
jgi:hypothetical protein